MYSQSDYNPVYISLYIHTNSVVVICLYSLTSVNNVFFLLFFHSFILSLYPSFFYLPRNGGEFFSRKVTEINMKSYSRIG